MRCFLLFSLTQIFQMKTVLSLLLSVDQLLCKNVEMECTLRIYIIWFYNKTKIKYQAYIVVHPMFLLINFL